MITCSFEQLPKEIDRSLRVWIGHDEYQTLIRIVDGRLKKQQTEALSAILQSTPHNLKSEAAEAVMLKAQRYQHCLEVLEEVKNQPITDTFETAKLT
jgi:hypothetical protein